VAYLSSGIAPSACFFWGFLLGIALHSLYAQTLFDTGLLSIGVCVLAFLAYARREKRGLLPILLALGLCTGVLRFELARPTLPPTLHAFDPNAFAYMREDDAGFIGSIRREFSSRIQTLFPGDSGRLLAGILYGERELSTNTKAEVRRAGLTHLVAVSGANVTIVFLALTRLLKPLRWSKRRRFFAFSLALVAFVMFVSPQAPVMRAAIMTWLIILAPLVGRIPDTKHLLLVSAVAFTFWRPESLLFDPSFILSFLAMLGLFSFGARISNAITERGGPRFLGELVGSTLGATLLVTPYSMWAFGQASLIGIVSNLFAVPLVPWSMGAGTIAIIIPWRPVVFVADLLLRAILLVASLASAVPYGAWDEVTVSPIFMIVCYVVIAFIWVYLNRKQVIHRKVLSRDKLSDHADGMGAIFFT
jgi:ComEC/Rec2-related protein